MDKKKVRQLCCLCKKPRVDRSCSYFGIPTDERRRSQWSEICLMQFSKNAFICEDHFFATDIIRRSTRDSLMPNAVPCLNLHHQESMQASLQEVPLIMPKVIAKSKDRKTQTHLTMLENRLERYKAMNKNLQDDIENLKRKLDETNVTTTSLRRIFTEGQMRKLMTPDQVEWSRSDISHAIRLHSSGPKAYNYMYKNGFPLPPVSTLEFWCRKVIVDEGFLTTSLGFIKHCAELKTEDKICVLALGEMKVVETYDSVADSKRPAEYVQVVMAQGLWKSWKRPVFFDFDCQMKKYVLYSIIAKLSQAKFPVVAVVCDMGPTHHKLWQDLGVTPERPWFPNPANPKEKVFVFADASHLLELVRNHFLGIGILWNSELLTSRTIAELMDHTSNSSESTDEHLNGVGNQMSAAQLFSKTTVEALRHCYSTGINLYKPIETADFLQLMKDWFDVLNSTIHSFTTPGKEPFGIALAEQQRTLMRMNKFMSSPIIPNKTTLEYFQKGVIMTNTALVLLQDYIKQKFSMTYILTSRINQMELNNLYGAIQNKGDSDDQLTQKEFKKRLHNYILDQNMKHFHGTENVKNNATLSTNALASSKSMCNQKETVEIDIVREHDHEILADHEPEVLDEPDTRLYSDTNNKLNNFLM